MGRLIPNSIQSQLLSPDSVNPFTKVKEGMSAADPLLNTGVVLRTEGLELATTEYAGSNPLVNAWLAIDNHALSGDSYTKENELDRLQLTYLESGSFTVQKSANYASVQILGRSEPVRGYAHSSARRISLQISVPPMTLQPQLASAKDLTFNWDRKSRLGPGPELGEDLSGGIQGNQQSRKLQGIASKQVQQVFLDKKTILNFLQSLVYPHYNPSARIISPPPPVHLIFGTFMWIRGIVISVNMKHSAPYDPKTCTPYFTDVNLEIEEANRPYSFRDAFTGKADKVY